MRSRHIETSFSRVKLRSVLSTAFSRDPSTATS